MPSYEPEWSNDAEAAALAHDEWVAEQLADRFEQESAAAEAEAERRAALLEEAYERAREVCTCGHRRTRHADSSGLCWVGYSPPGPRPCECMTFEPRPEET